ELVADLVDRCVPRDTSPLSIHELHWIFQAAVAMHELANRSALGAVRAAADRAIPTGFLTNPYAVGDFGNDRAADRTVGADRLGRSNDGAGRCRRTGFRASHADERQRTQGSQAAGRQARATQKGTAIEAAGQVTSKCCGEVAAARFAFRSLDQHGWPPLA